ncbi:MAG: LuxR C-terminal-related transcriptional regulator [Burkholderiales bacterium]|nr:LuxR C-terminal-related transcriptional regulator [Burkholderiales bacterium]
MLKHTLIFGAVAGLLIAGLKFIEYRWLVVAHSVEIYGALVAAVFAAVGIWLGLKLTREKVVVKEVQAPAEFIRDDAKVAALGLTPRELEMLGLIAQGLSNREIADKVFVSENTVKTHLARIFDKLDARRRTQAVERGRALRLIP